MKINIDKTLTNKVYESKYKNRKTILKKESYGRQEFAL